MNEAVDLSQQDKIWDYFQNDSPDAFEGSRSRLSHLVSRLNVPGGRVLDIGVGTGIFEEIAISHGFEVYSADPSVRSIDSLRQRFNMGERAQVAYGQNLPFVDDYFDSVVLSEVFEHLDAPTTDATLKECLRVLKPGGRLLGTVPARENLQDQMVVCPDCGKRFHRWGHQQTFTADSMRTLLAANFEPVEIIERPYITFKLMNWKGRSFSALKLILWKLGMHGSAENVFFEVLKKPTSKVPSPKS